MADGPGDKGSLSYVRSAGLLLAIPTLLIVSPLVGFFVGSWLDGRLKSTPWLSILGLLLGFAAAGRETHRIYRRYEQEERERAKRD